MRFNELRPAAGSRRTAKRVGRGTASGHGKTCGRGHKGQKARSGGGSARGFEGGQMPLHRRLPKFGFKSRKGSFNAELKVGLLAGLNEAAVDVEVLKAAKLVSRRAQRVKIIAGGKLDKAIVVKNLAVTRGARAAIEAAGGKVED